MEQHNTRRRENRENLRRLIIRALLADGSAWSVAALAAFVETPAGTVAADLADMAAAGETRRVGDGWALTGPPV